MSCTTHMQAQAHREGERRGGFPRARIIVSKAPSTKYLGSPRINPMTTIKLVWVNVVPFCVATFFVFLTPRLLLLSYYLNGRVEQIPGLYGFNIKSSFFFCFYLQENDIIHLINKVDENWYEGSVNGRTGYFPQTYVQVVTPLP